MNRYWYITLFVLLSLGLQSPLSAQNQSRNLTSVLNSLSKEYNVRFSFSPSLTDNIFPKQVNTDGTIDEVLKKVLNDTEFSYRLINNQYYYIYKDADKKLPVAKVEKPAEQLPSVDTIVYHNVTMSVADIAARPPKQKYDADRSDLVPMPYSYYPHEIELPKLAVKSNLLYDATSTMNLGVEFGLGHRTTLDVSGNYNPWTFSENRKMKLWMIQPELRLWTCERFNGGFGGVYAFGGAFNWGGMLPWGFNSGKMFGTIENSTISNYRFDGWLVGAGIGYGYHWILNNRFGIEAEFGLGYAYLDYDKYRCEKCGDILKHETKHYVGPTKAAVSLIYLFK